MRIRSIDMFRGISILLMVFFSLILTLSRSIPDPLMHNVRGSVHIGDFVLPMFLFASGMSLVFFAKKREALKRRDYILDVIERFGKLAIIAMVLSPFSAGGLFEMDEVMLSALLFIPSLFLIRFSGKAIAAVSMILLLSYIILQHISLLPDFAGHYLGGYAAAPFYLPVMLAGVIAGKMLKEAWKLFLLSIPITIAFIVLIPPYKMDVSPSFMALSVSFSLLVFNLVKNLKSGMIEYLGRKPIRYWVLMFVVLLVPLGYYKVYSGTYPEDLLGDFEAILATLLSLPLLYLISRGMDYIFKYFPIDKYFNVQKKSGFSDISEETP